MFKMSALPLSYLPQANAKNNPLVQKLSILFPLETATSLFYFEKEGVLAHLIHLLKYKGVHQLGTFFGEWLAEHLLEYSFISSVEGIIPVPLHPKRKKIRGYNQAEIIAKTVAQKLNLPLYTAALKHIKNTTSLVLLGDRERENEMAGAILYAKKIQNAKHLLLIDDVLTTGATLNTCAQSILEEGPIKLSIAVIGYRL